MADLYDENMNIDPALVVCEKCGGIVRPRGSGVFACEDCGHEVMDDYGKVKTFLEKRGPSNILEISVGTGLERSVVSKLLSDGRIQVHQNATAGPTCANCGTPIQRGKYCTVCMSEMSGNRPKGSVPRSKTDSSKMRFLGSEPGNKKKKGK